MRFGESPGKARRFVPAESRAVLQSGKLILQQLILVVVGLSFAVAVQGQETAQFFKQNCSSCHWIGGGRLIGPDLKQVEQRRDRDWLVRFIVNPKALIDARDPYALRLQAEAKGVVMLQVPGMTDKLANTLLDFIAAESMLDSSQFAGKVVAMGPYSEADVSSGLQLFTGRTELTNKAPACLSCHTVNAVGGSLGGRLGPDLTAVMERLQGRAAISAWLTAPPTPTMKAVFQDRSLEEKEIQYLIAYFESVSDNRGYNFDSLIVWMSAIFCGLGGSVFGMVLFSGIWSNRFRAVRRPLVNVTKIRGES